MNVTSAMQVLPTAIYELKDDNDKTQIVVIVLGTAEELDRSHLHYRELREHWFIPAGANIAAFANGSSNIKVTVAAAKKQDIIDKLDGGLETGLKYQFSSRTQLASSDWTDPPTQKPRTWDDFKVFKLHNPDPNPDPLDDLWFGMRFADLGSTPVLEEVAWFAPKKTPAPAFGTPSISTVTKFDRKALADLPSNYFFYDERIYRKL